MPNRRGKRFRATTKIPVGFVGAGVRFSADLIDISTSGCLLRYSKVMEPGELGRLGIQVGHETLRAAAEVKRTIPGVGVAFEFKHMYPHDRELLRHLIFWISNAHPAGS